MTLITYKPRRTLTNEFDSLFNDFWSFNGHSNYRQGIQPSFDITQNKSSYFITADLPGVDKKDIDISLKDDTITISAERKASDTHDEKFSRYNNIQYGLFEKSFYMPDDANTDKINAKMNNGVLSIELTKAKKVASDVKRISIK